MTSVGERFGGVESASVKKVSWTHLKRSKNISTFTAFLICDNILNDFHPWMKLQVNSVVDSKLSLFCRISLKTEIVNSYSSVVEKVECGLEQGGDRHAAAGDCGHPGDGLQ